MINHNNQLVNLKHNVTFGVHYEMSQLMEYYIKCLTRLYTLKIGVPVFDGFKIFESDFDKTLDNWYNISNSKLQKSPNTMHKFGASNILTQEEFDLIISIFRPFMGEYFGHEYNAKYKLFADFTVHYSKSFDKKLNVHVDDSDITINICLTNTFDTKETSLSFTDVPNTLFSEKKTNLINNIIFNRGNVAIHKGNHVHCTNSIENNDTDCERCNLILWIKLI